MGVKHWESGYLWALFVGRAFYFEGAVFANRAFCSVWGKDTQRHVDNFSTRGVSRCVRAFKTSSPCCFVEVLVDGTGVMLCSSES